MEGGAGAGYHKGPPRYEPDLSVEENLVNRNILSRENSWLFLTESALVRIMHIAMNAVVEDLLNNDPPLANLPETPEYSENGPARLIFTGLDNDELQVRG